MKDIRIWDIDKTLCVGNCYSPEECLNAEPIQENIAKINEEDKEYQVILYTGRPHRFAEATLDWLEANHVRYSGIKFNKLRGDMYIDSDSRRPEEL
jgi:phosphoglycolate phosphatase-like HAD superfamily hydrolase